jgi:hypothetical protein
MGKFLTSNEPYPYDLVMSYLNYNAAIVNNREKYWQYFYNSFPNHPISYVHTFSQVSEYNV